MHWKHSNFIKIMHEIVDIWMGTYKLFVIIGSTSNILTVPKRWTSEVRPRSGLYQLVDQNRNKYLTKEIHVISIGCQTSVFSMLRHTFTYIQPNTETLTHGHFLLDFNRYAVVTPFVLDGMKEKETWQNPQSKTWSLSYLCLT